MATHILQGNLILPDRVQHGQLVVDGSVIQEIVTGEPRYIATRDFGDGYIAPGFIDLHVHGIAGVDVMDGTQDSVALMARRFAAHGVIGFMATTVTQSLDVTLRAVEQIRDSIAAQKAGASPGAQILGSHLEGPWLSVEYRGVHNERYLLPPKEETVRRVLAAGGGTVRVVSIAPELPGAGDVIRLLRAGGVYVSIAHTAATYEQALAAVDLGATHVTHCFNAMTGLHHRKPGTLGAALLTDDLFCELIADGIHVHPAAMQLLLRTKGRDRVMLITDSLSSTELSDGSYRLGGLEVLVRDGQARLADGTLAGSTITLDQAVRNLIRLCGVSLVDAVYMATSVPATAIGLGDRKGKLRAGYDADLAVLDARLQPIATYITGAPFTP